MPRLISEIKDPKLRKLAELRRKQDIPQTIKADELKAAFVWDATDEPSDFWKYVEEDIITELPNDHPLYDKL